VIGWVNTFWQAVKLFIDLSFNGKHVADMIAEAMTCFAAAFLFVSPLIAGKGSDGARRLNLKVLRG
jgi:hypothetical protein